MNISHVILAIKLLDVLNILLSFFRGPVNHVGLTVMFEILLVYELEAS